MEWSQKIRKTKTRTRSGRRRRTRMKLEWDWSEVEWVGMDVQKYAETKQNEELPVSQSVDGRIYH